MQDGLCLHDRCRKSKEAAASDAAADGDLLSGFTVQSIAFCMPVWWLWLSCLFEFRAVAVTAVECCLRVHSPELGTDLVTTLTSLDVNDLAHDEGLQKRISFVLCVRVWL